MLYLLFVLTFLCGILFYGMSPHDRSLDMTAHQAEGMIVTFLAQHQAARDYLYTWLGASNTANTGNLQSSGFLKATSGIFNFETMMPRGVTFDMCANNQGVPGGSSTGEPQGCFVSHVVEGDGKKYVITYGGWIWDNEKNDYTRPSWWPRPGQKMRRFESWRRAIANRTRGSISCGTLVEVDTNKWCIDNGETVYKNESADPKECMTQVPEAVVGVLPPDSGYKDDLLFCMSEFKQGLGNYVPGVSYFYDGYSNAGFGQHDVNATTWTNLAGASDITLQSATPSVNFIVNDKPYITGQGQTLNTSFSLSDNYTITIVVDLAQVSLNVQLFANTFTQGASETVPGETVPVFEFQQHCQHEEIEGPCFQVNDDSFKYWFTGYNGGKLTSWTIVKDGSNLKIYENAVLRTVEGETMGAPPFSGVETFRLTTEGGISPFIYGIRYYGSALTPEQIQKNFKVDQKRFGIPDVNNGKTEAIGSATERSVPVEGG